MKAQVKKRPYKKIALILSLCTLVIWGILGTGASLAWFTDTTPEINNIFHFGEFDVEVSHYIGNGNWEKLDGQTQIFDDEALYEPGYVQVVYLQVENAGTLPFVFHTAVNVNNCVEAVNAYGQRFMLQDYLKFGLVMPMDEQDVINGSLERELAKENATITLKSIADMPLHNYSSKTVTLQPGEITYIALVVYMPESVNNIANYRGDIIPRVELGVTVKADQIIN